MSRCKSHQFAHLIVSDSESMFGSEWKWTLTFPENWDEASLLRRLRRGCAAWSRAQGSESFMWDEYLASDDLPKGVRMMDVTTVPGIEITRYEDLP